MAERGNAAPPQQLTAPKALIRKVLPGLSSSDADAAEAFFRTLPCDSASMRKEDWLARGGALVSEGHDEVYELFFLDSLSNSPANLAKLWKVSRGLSESPRIPSQIVQNVTSRASFE